ncbi:hypothetical protein CM19_02510 [Candidatus Acidianus copahuensis]|uniref:Uncharacterized protein n=1 Tax=Candidatus Acidianus copahuensis TaxID=1160895 RepID=A0A031LUM0_9CREN|nr:ion channel [Candidatus Acidianus copahuensis]EZQ11164.1 hypothetical protein CM19_02510 [Candidatus Acidianus copahuensis]
MLLSNRSIAALGLLLAVVIFGVLGSYILGQFGHNFNQKMDLVNSIYFTIITLSTVGYGDIVPITPIAKLFVVILIVFGMGAFLTALTSISGDIASRRILDFSTKLTSIEEEFTKEQILLIGSGYVNTAIANELKNNKTKYIFAVSDSVIADKLQRDGFKVVQMDLLSEEEIKKLHPDRAKLIVIDMNNPVDAVYVILILGDIAKDAKMVVIVNSDDAERRLSSVKKMVKDISIINPQKEIALELLSNINLNKRNE